MPKQYFGHVSDDAGFSGGTSLALMSSRYGKSVKRIQSTLIQAITDAVNLMLLDKGLDSYVNNFTIKMQSPTTQEEKDRRDNAATQLSNIRDILDLCGDINDASIKLKITKSLLATVVKDPDILAYVQDEIDVLEQEAESGVTNDDSAEDEFADIDSEIGGSADTYSDNTPTLAEIPLEDSNTESSDDTLPTPGEVDAGVPEAEEESTNESLQEDLPSFSDMDVDGYG